MRWSILVCALPHRPPRAVRTINYLIAGHDDIECIVMSGDGQTIGEKRNRLMDAASGEYLSFVDDDDDVDHEYVESVLKALDDSPGVDVVCFGQLVKCGKRREYCTYSAEYNMEFTRVNSRLYLWHGKPAHTMVWRSEIARMSRFPETNEGEDIAWSTSVAKHVKYEAQIDDVLYYYHKAER